MLKSSACEKPKLKSIGSCKDPNALCAPGVPISDPLTIAIDMKSSKTVLALILASFCGLCHAAGFPFSPTWTELVAADSKISSDSVRLKVSVSLDAANAVKQVTAGSITVCSPTACFRPEMPNAVVDLDNTRSGASSHIATFVVPRDTIHSVHFDTVAGRSTLVGDVNLAAPLEFPTGAASGELLVLVTEQVNGPLKLFTPSTALGSLHHPERKSVYYNPSFDTSVMLDKGVKFDLQKGATSGPQIFSIAVHDTGEKYPLIDIYPEVSLSRPLSLSAAKINKGGAVSSTPVDKSVGATGVIQIDPEQADASPVTGGVSTLAAAATDTCVNLINAYLTRISAGLATTGSVYLQGCETISPYVHIVVSNNNDSRPALRLGYTFASGWTAGRLELRRIEDSSFRTQVAINGFKWAGDSGISPGTGYAEGFAQQDAACIWKQLCRGRMLAVWYPRRKQTHFQHLSATAAEVERGHRCLPLVQRANSDR
jgi:hypothetical protein